METSETNRVLALAEPIAGEFGLEVLEVELKGSPPRRLLRVLLDSPTQGRGVTLDDCTAVSRRLGDVIEAHAAVGGGYLLEVSSPGVNRPLRKPEHFRRVLGKKVRVRFRHPVADRRGVLARLAEVDETRLRLECDDGETLEISFADVEKANLEYEFETPSKPSPGGKRGKRRRK